MTKAALLIFALVASAIAHAEIDCVGTHSLCNGTLGTVAIEDNVKQIYVSVGGDTLVFDKNSFDVGLSLQALSGRTLSVSSFRTVTGSDGSAKIVIDSFSTQ